MKKKIISIISLILSIFIVFQFSACTQKSQKDEQNININVGAEPISYSNKKINGKDVMLAEYGKSDYKIVIPENCTYTEKYSAEELQKYLELSTACRLPIITDSAISSFDENSQYIFIGYNKALKEQTSFKLDYTMPRNAPRIVTVGKSVFLAGQSDEIATLYAVYKFLYYEIAFQAYAVDCIYYENKSKLVLLDFDYNYEPAMDYCTGYGEVSTPANAKNAARLYLRAKDTAGAGAGSFGVDAAKDFAAWCHSLYGFASASQYSKDYPHWFGNGQLCYSQIMETDDEVDLWEKCAESAIEMLDANDAPYIMLGGADNQACCKCSLCNENYKIYGVTGVMTRFLNKVAEELEKHYDECDKHKYEDVILVGFAYEAYTAAPTKIDENGEIVPLDSSVVLRHNAGICYTPMHKCQTHPLEGDNQCKINSSFLSYLQGWSKVTQNLFVYDYGYYNTGKLHYCDEWGSIQENIKTFEKCNVKYVLGQNATSNGLEPFAALRIYVKSKLAWDPQLNQEMLIKDFMNHYYGDAAPLMMEFFDEIAEHYRWMEVKNGTACASIYSTFLTTDNWPRDFLVRMETLLKSAYNVAEQTKDATIAQQDYYKENVYKERTMIRFVNFTSYKSYYSEKEKLVEIAELSHMLKKYKIVTANGDNAIVL